MAWDSDNVTSIQTAILKWYLEALQLFISQFHFLEPLQLRSMRLFKMVIVILYYFPRFKLGRKF